jgi:osmoprotectant transport system permease protein
VRPRAVPRSVKFVGNRVLLVLILGGFLAGWGLAFLTTAPNRLVIGTGIRLDTLLVGWRASLLLPAALLVLGVFLPQVRRTHLAMVIAASLWLAGLVWLAGAHALRLAETGSAISRTSFGGGFWLLVFFSWLAAADSIQRLRLGAPATILANAAVIAPCLGLLVAGELAQLSLLKEYANRRDVFHTAFFRHLEIVLATLLPTLLIGIPLGVAAFRRERWRIPLFAVLNVIQTVPSIALFGLLLAPLAFLAMLVPGLSRLGIGGVGLAPAVIALTMYSLLPVVRSTVAGLTQVPRPVIEAATGMGMSRSQIWRCVELPLALPIFLSGLRVATVQTVGLAVVAALIGAGGLGALVFQGLSSTALDLVLLGVVPVVALAVAFDAFSGSWPAC